MHYQNVQGLRAIAASLVVFAHCGCVMYVPSAMMPLGLSGMPNRHATKYKRVVLPHTSMLAHFSAVLDRPGILGQY
jgi:hypothetical protein